jgi:hypothetical protein
MGVSLLPLFIILGQVVEMEEVVYVRVHWTYHALKRCKQRGVNPERVERALRALPEIHGTYEHYFPTFGVVLTRLDKPEYEVLILTVHKGKRRFRYARKV